MRASQHAIEDGAAEGDFHLLCGECACPQPPSDDRFVTADRGLRERSLSVAGRDPPLHPAIGADRRDMLDSLIGGIVVLTFYCIGTRRDNHLSIVGQLTVIGDIGRELSDRHIDLVEQPPYLGVCLALSAYWPDGSWSYGREPRGPAP